MEDVFVYKTHVSSSYLIHGIIYIICLFLLGVLGGFTLAKIDSLDELFLLLIIFIVVMTYCLSMGIYLIKLYYQQGIIIFDNRIESFESRLFSSPRHIVYYYSDIECMNKTNRFFKNYITITKSTPKCDIFIGCFENYNNIYPVMETAYWKYQDVNKGI